MSLPAVWGDSDVSDTFYDMFGAITPEEAQLPISYWTKGRILLYVRSSPDLHAAEPVLKRMRLDDLRSAALIKTVNLATGMIFSSERWRHTDFYSLDTEWILNIIRGMTE